jgi:hypothetical protein
MRRTHVAPLDYDDGLVPGQIAAGIMHLRHVTDSEEHEVRLLLRWSYGSAFGMFHGLLRRRMREPWAAAVFGATLMTATFSLFPLLGRTPPRPGAGRPTCSPRAWARTWRTSPPWRSPTTRSADPGLAAQPVK